MLFLDSNAHMPMSKKAINAFIKFNNSLAGHGHPLSPSRSGRLASQAIEESRTKIANLLGASAEQIIFTNSCTQACEWGIYLLSKLSADKTFIFPGEHSAVRQACKKYNKEYSNLKFNENGEINKFDYLDSKVICIKTQNETGIIQPIEKIKCKYLFSDITQSIGKENINLNETNIDIAVFAGHKICGPNIGFIYLKDLSYYKEFGTGSRYYMDIPGTPDVGSIVSSAAALEEAIKTLPERIKNMNDFKNILEPGLKELGVEIVGEFANRSPSTTFIRVPEKNNMQLMLKLGERNIFVGLGSACGSIHTSKNQFLADMGYNDMSELLRISNYGFYGEKEAKLFLQEFKKII